MQHTLPMCSVKLIFLGIVCLTVWFITASALLVYGYICEADVMSVSQMGRCLKTKIWQHFPSNV